MSNNRHRKVCLYPYEEKIVATITTQEVIPEEVQFFEIPIIANQETGLNETSRILLNRIHTVDKKLRLLKRLGKVKPEIWESVLKSFWLALTNKQA
ncbi:type II toxin-antitoxin system PemK/MazF family toxin [endosymbiont GvMRE of Glomus versiforme]|uniref:type II toxin-antitoxin system PemK/MazF family toxin n=1 Tax=endosymbiont GvMRE of Glomus versiforme TaxID=2039283 RepID=UPI0011C482E2|nr:type II toxin-antitoxin system PemK/MazF family toxin [endosymbiont GvMRE of Glomus versiforme]